MRSSLKSKIMKRLILIAIAFILFSKGFSQEASRWRGPSGNGIYDESGLLKQWPEKGPELIWSYEGLGEFKNHI